MSVDHDNIRREIDEGIGSIGRIRIIAELARDPDKAFTTYAIVAATGLKRNDVKTNLARLVAIGWVKEHKSIHWTFQINLANKLVAEWVGFLRSTGYLGLDR
jgi:hypothetical protein